MSSSINFSSMATKLASTLVLSSTQKDILVSTSTVTDSYASLNYDLRVNTTDHEGIMQYNDIIHGKLILNHTHDPLL